MSPPHVSCEDSTSQTRVFATRANFSITGEPRENCAISGFKLKFFELRAISSQIEFAKEAESAERHFKCQHLAWELFTLEKPVKFQP